MVGFHGVLRSEFQSKFCLIISEDRPALWSFQYLSKLLKDHSEEPTHVVNLLSFVHKNVLTHPSIRKYDFINGDYSDIGNLYSELLNNVEGSKRNVLVVDDLALFSINNDRETKKIYNFFKQLAKVYSQLIVFCTVDTVSKEDIALLCSLAEHVVILKNPDEEDTPEFLCNLLTIKPSGKTSLEQTYYEVKDGSVIASERKVDKADISNDNNDDIMRSLTTFKLTIEESEKESKNQLYLPYLDAQRTTVPDPNEDYYDDDDEDDDD